MRKFIVFIALMIIPTTCSAGAMQDVQNDIGTDKIAHFGVGYIIDDQLGRHTKFTPLERFLAVAAIAYAKENTDDHFDRHDLLATCLGGLTCEIHF